MPEPGVRLLIIVFLDQVNLIAEDYLEVRMVFLYFIPVFQGFDVARKDFVVRDGQPVESVFQGFVHHFRNAVDRID